MSLSYLCENLADRIGFVEPETAAETKQASDEPVMLSEVVQARAGFAVRRPVVETVEDVPEVDDKRLMRSRAGFIK